MRRVFLCLFVFVCASLCSCHKQALEPVLLTETRELDAEVLDLIATKVAAVRAAPSDANAHADLGLAYEANALWEAAEQSYARAWTLDDSKPIWLLHRALALREAGQFDAALELLREAARRLPKDPAVQQRLGHWLLDRGDAEGARAAFLQALSRRPDQAEFLTGLAGVELARERWNEALALCNRALRMMPGYRPAYYTMGQALQGLGRGEQAKEALAAGMSSAVEWYPDETSARLTSYVRSTTALSQYGADAAHKGNFAQAVDIFEKLVQRKPSDADLLNNLGANLVEVGQLERAGEVLQRALAIAPESFAVHLNLSEYYRQTQKLADARREGERAVEIGGTVGRTHSQLARVLEQQKDLEGAYREYKAAVALDARDQRLFLALTQTAMSLNRAEEARGWCRKALEFDPYSVPGRGMQGILAFAAGDFAEAHAALDVMQQVAPQDPRTARLRSELEKAGR